MLQKLFSARSLIRIQDDADACSQLRGERADRHRPAHQIAQFTAEAERGAASDGRREQEGELVPSQMSAVSGPEADEASSQLDERLVARGMAQGVVDLAEVGQVEEQQGKPFLLCAGVLR